MFAFYKELWDRDPDDTPFHRLVTGHAEYLFCCFILKRTILALLVVSNGGLPIRCDFSTMTATICVYILFNLRFAIFNKSR